MSLSSKRKEPSHITVSHSASTSKHIYFVFHYMAGFFSFSFFFFFLSFLLDVVDYLPALKESYQFQSHSTPISLCLCCPYCLSRRMHESTRNEERGHIRRAAFSVVVVRRGQRGTEARQVCASSLATYYKMFLPRPSASASINFQNMP